MTGPQRKMHVFLWLVLGPLALVGLVLAWQWRPAEPVHDGAMPGVEASINEDDSSDDAETGGSR